MSKYQIASGGILINPKNQIVVIHRPIQKDWSLPKGKQKTAETLLQTAIREVKEETGIQAKARKFQGTLSYFTGTQYKVVTYWKCDIIRSQEFKPSKEVDKIAWIPIQQVKMLLTYSNEVELVLYSYITSL